MKVCAFLPLGPFVLAACAAAPPPAPILAPDPAAPPQGERPTRIVAFYNGEPLSWQAVAEKMLELDLKSAVDQYARWRLLEDRRKELGIANTPPELRRRAETYLGQLRRQLGDDAFQAQLSREGTTVDAWLDRLAGSRFLDDTLALEKVLRYSALLEDALEIDRMLFVEESDANKFLEKARAQGYDAAARELEKGERKPTQGRIPHEVFPKSAPPANPVLDEWIVEELLKLKPGQFTGVEHSRSNLHYVVLLRNFRKGEHVSYEDVRTSILEGILREPPSPADHRRWFERELGKCRIEYGQPKAAAGKSP